MTTPPPAGIRTTGVHDAEATRLILVRHGEARCNVDGILGGTKGCTGLTDEGRAQVERLVQRVRGLGAIDGLYASTLKRAIETAEILGDGLGISDIEIEPGFRELDGGEADGMTWAQYAEHFEEPDWDVDPDIPIAPGGESWTGFVARASAAARTFVEAHGGSSLLVATHAGVIEATMLAFLPLASGVSRLKLRTTHASVTVWEISEGRWLLERYNA